MTESMFSDELAPVVITIDAQIECIEREIKIRRYVYQKRVSGGHMSQKLADKETARINAVLDTLKAIKARGISFPDGVDG